MPGHGIELRWAAGPRLDGTTLLQSLLHLRHIVEIPTQAHLDAAQQSTDAGPTTCLPEPLQAGLTGEDADRGKSGIDQRSTCSSRRSGMNQIALTRA
jgi:hypothetical protein